jgi:hypothetical protein
VSTSHPFQDILINPLTSKTSSLLLGEFLLSEWAAAGLLELPQGDAFCQTVWELLISWQISRSINNTLETEDREVFIALSQTYLKWKEATRQEGRRKALEESRQEGKLESIPCLLALGLTLEQIA